MPRRASSRLPVQIPYAAVSRRATLEIAAYFEEQRTDEGHHNYDGVG